MIDRVQELREPRGCLFGPERRDMNTDAADRESNQAVVPAEWMGQRLASRGHQCCGICINQTHARTHFSSPYVQYR
jgi:hypothetical protein